MKLKVKELQLASGGPFIAVLNEKTAKKLSIFPMDRLLMKKKKLSIICVTDISSKGIKEGEIGLFQEAWEELKGAKEVEVEHAEKPESIKYIKKKLDGQELNEREINAIVKDITNNELSETELTYFVSGCYSKEMTLKETVALTNAIVHYGKQLHFKKGEIILDKHCIGGVAGNRTTMILVPILASLGYKIPKTSSRAITSPSGTSDTMEVLAPVTLSKKKIEEVIRKTNACIAWGGNMDLAAADDKMIKVRHPLSIDPTGMLISSILAKKKAAGATHVLIDIPWGEGAKVATKREAKKLRKLFLRTEKHMGFKMKVILTDGSQPIGNGIGPALEAADVLSILKGNGPNDLREKAIYMAAEMLKLIKVKKPKEKVLNALETGKAYHKLQEIIRAQGGLKHPVIPKAKYFFNVMGTHDAVIKHIDNKRISTIAALAGAPEDKTAGIYLRVRKGRKINRGLILYTVYSNSKTNLDIVKKQLKDLNPISY